jgi:glycosyltransferase involved in cell wall biosynthesis
MRRQLGERDQHYAFVNYASMLAADRVLFNSQYHHDSFFAALPNFLKHFPEYNELGTITALQSKSQVLPVGIDLKRLEIEDWGLEIREQSPISSPQSLILWNQRWEYDKNPADFFQALYALADEGIPFRLALCGQQYGKRPPIFDEATERLSEQIVHVGYAKDKLYKELLWQAAVTISTAHHEFFGISVLEAIACHTFPILPHRLSYPEQIPEAHHLRCLYRTQGGLVQRLRWALTHAEEAAAIAAELAAAVQKYDWTRLAPPYDAILAGLAE